MRGNSAPLTRADLLIPGGFALLKILLHLPVLHRYGFHHDELYFIACGEHLSFGYVDHAPLVPWIARLATTLFGDSLVGLRILGVLAGAVTIFLTGLLVRRMGGGRFAQTVACVAMLGAPVYLRSANMLCISAFEPLFWVACAYLLVRIIQEDNPRLWPWVGVVAGLGLMNKHSMLFFGFGLAVGLLMTPLRRHFRSPWLYLAGAIVLLIFLPNLVWQVSHEWPTAGFVRDLNENVMDGVSKLQFVAGQLLYLNPLNSVVWIWGLVFCFSREGRPYRLLGWIWVAVYLLLLIAGSKIYYLAPAYPALLACGGLAIERFVQRTGRAWLKPVTVGLLVLGGLSLAPAALPYLDIDATDRFMDKVTLGAFGNIYELTGDLHGMFGWPERVEAVAEIYHALPPDERAQAMVFASGYGNAGAIDLFGREHGLPRAVSFTQTYWVWGYGGEEPGTVIGVGFDPEFLSQIWEEVEVLKSLEIEHANPWQNPYEITVCRKPKLTMAKVWPQVRPW